MSNPFVEEGTGVRLITGYRPNIALSVVGVACFGILSAIYLFWMIRRFTKWMLPLTIGAMFMTLGFIVRIPMKNSPDSLGIYIIQYMFILLSPCAFLAQDYMILPRLATFLNAEDCLFLKSRLVVRTFVWADAITFFLQAAGGGMTAVEGNETMADIGHWVAIVGLVIQFVCFMTFCSLAIVWALRLKKRTPWKWSRQLTTTGPNGMTKTIYLTWKEDWRTLYAALMFSTIGIIVRSVFRIIEFAQGYDGKLRTVEWYFYAFDTLPIFVAISIYAIIWPPHFMRPGELSPFAGGSGAGHMYGMTQMAESVSPASADTPLYRNKQNV